VRAGCRSPEIIQNSRRDQLANFNERELALDGSSLFFTPLFYSARRTVSDSWYLFQQGASTAAEAAASRILYGGSGDVFRAHKYRLRK
jgi:hypothetical protein